MIAQISLQTAALMLFLALLVIVDLSTHRIPNRLTVGAAATAGALHVMSGGLAALLGSFAGLATGLLIFAPFFFIGRNFGAGDIKAMAAVGTFLGPEGALAAAGCTLIAGGIGAILMLLANGGIGSLQALFGRWAARTYLVCTTGRLALIEPPPGDAARRRFPYGLAIACGTAASLMWRT